MKTLSRTRYRGPRAEVGFSLVEVMVALVVMSVGLLGIAKMQAVALSNTTTARIRSLAALEAASLASAMRADRAYWSNVTADPAVTTSAGATSFTSNDGTLAAPSTGAAACTYPTSAGPCTAPEIAAIDLQSWATDLVVQVPNASSSVSCTIASKDKTTGLPIAPVACKIEIDWTEQQVASNSQQATQLTNQLSNGPLPQTSYILYIDP